jgi:hypothetical protein
MSGTGVGVFFSLILSVSSFSCHRRLSGSNGDCLGGFPLTEGEQKGITIADRTMQELRAKGSKCLVGWLGVPKKLNK